jgi:cytosine deaminase
VSKYLVRNGLTPAGKYVDIVIRDGVIDELLPAESADWSAFSEEERLDAGGRFVTPPLVEPHFHLDFSLVAGDPDWNHSGTLVEGSQKWRRNRDTLDVETLYDQAETILQWFLVHGITRVRSHVSVSTDDTHRVTIDAMRALQDDYEDIVDVQLVAFPTDSLTSESEIERFRTAVKGNFDVVGGLPQYECTREDGIKHLETVVDLAERYDLPVDAHIDETDDPQARMLEVLTKLVLDADIGDRTTASHTTAMHSYSDFYTDTLMWFLQESGLSVVTNPLTNSVIQGRYDGYPKRRGHTRIDELLDAGIDVGIGQDDIGDLFYMYGNGDLLTAAHVLVHFAHMNSKEDVATLWEMLLQGNASVYGVEDYGLEEGNEGSVVVYDGKSPFNVLRTQAPRRAVIRDGQLLASTQRDTRIHDGAESTRLDLGENVIM